MGTELYPHNQAAYEAAARMMEGAGRERPGEPFRIVDEARDCREVFEAAGRSLAAGWELYFRRAGEFFERNGHLRVPKSHVTPDGLALGSWLLAQRRAYAGGTLGAERAARLEEVGMDFRAGRERSFEAGLAALRAYCEERGSADVKASYVAGDGYPLGRWVGNVRRKRRGECGSPLTKEQVARLDGLGMVWDAAGHRWERNFANARAFFEENGHLRVPRGYRAPDGSRTGVWLENQRAARRGRNPKAAPLTKEQERRLSGIGMEWGAASKSRSGQGTRGTSRQARA